MAYTLVGRTVLQDLETKAGDTMIFDATFFSDAAKTVAYSLAGYVTMRMQIRARAELPSYVLELTLGSGLSVSTNVLTVTATATQMDLPAGTYVYDIEGTDGGGIVDTLLAGHLKITRSVSR